MDPAPWYAWTLDSDLSIHSRVLTGSLRKISIAHESKYSLVLEVIFSVLRQNLLAVSSVDHLRPCTLAFFVEGESVSARRNSNRKYYLSIDVGKKWCVNR